MLYHSFFDTLLVSNFEVLRIKLGYNKSIPF